MVLDKKMMNMKEIWQYPKKIDFRPGRLWLNIENSNKRLIDHKKGYSWHFYLSEDFSEHFLRPICYLNFWIFTNHSIGVLSKNTRSNCFPYHLHFLMLVRSSINVHVRLNIPLQNSYQSWFKLPLATFY